MGAGDAFLRIQNLFWKIKKVHLYRWISWNILKFPLKSVIFLEFFWNFNRYRWDILKVWNFHWSRWDFFRFWNSHQYQREFFKLFEIFTVIGENFRNTPTGASTNPKNFDLNKNFNLNLIQIETWNLKLKLETDT